MASHPNRGRPSGASNPATVAQRQADYRARKAAAALHEVRGVFLPRELHAKLKELARGLLAK